MSSSNETLERAAGLSTLDPDDPERIEAYRQAAADPQLRRALAQGEHLWKLLATYEPPPPSLDVLNRVRSAVLAEMCATVSSDQAGVAPVRQRGWLAVLERPVASLLPAASVLFIWGVFVLRSLPAGHLDKRIIWSGTLALTAALAAWAVLHVAWLGLTLTVAAAAVFAAVACHGVGLAAPAWGLKCASATLLCAVFPLGTVLALRLTGRLRGKQSAALFAGAAAAGGLGGMAALHLVCKVHTLVHVGLIHGGAMAFAALIGLAIARFPPLRRALRARADP